MMPPSAKRANPSSLGTCFHYRCRHGMSLPAVLDKCPETSASERLPWKASPSFGAGWKRVLCKRGAWLQPTKVVTMSPWRSISSGIIGIDAVMDLFIGVVNCFGTMVSTVTVSHREQLLDVARYNEMS